MRENKRVRFNWGFHDGAADAKNGRTERFGTSLGRFLENHFDQVYAAGCRAGIAYAKAGRDHSLSDEAWLDYCTG